VTMQNRRTFPGIAAASLLPVGIDAQTSGPRPPAELARHALTGPLDGFEAVLVELNIQPGSRSSGPGHRHPSPVLGYVVEGQMRLPSTTSRNKSCLWAARSSSRLALFTPRSVLRGLMAHARAGGKGCAGHVS